MIQVHTLTGTLYSMCNAFLNSQFLPTVGSPVSKFTHTQKYKPDCAYLHISPISSIKYTNHNINLYGNFTVTPFYHVGPEFVHGNSHFVFCRFKVKPFQTKCLYEHIPVNDWCVIILSGEQTSMSQFIDSECWMTCDLGHMW